MSPSSQRVWIEIYFVKNNINIYTPSPSSQRVWIEMDDLVKYVYHVSCRPLHRGCGLKLYRKIRFEIFRGVALFTEGVD